MTLGLSPGLHNSKIGEVTEMSSLAFVRWGGGGSMRDPDLDLGSPFPGWQFHGVASPFPAAPVGGEREWAQGQLGVWIVASSAGSLLFNIKSRARNCIKTCIIIPEEGRAQPLVIAGLL